MKQLLFNTIELGGFDLIYSAGLFDYLNDKVAKALIRKLIAMLRPGGTLYVANFTPELPDIPYMEAVMDWWLTYRTVNELIALVDNAEAVRVSASYMSVSNCHNAVAWLRVEKPV